FDVREEFLDPKISDPIEESDEAGLRPKHLDEFVGQRELKEKLGALYLETGRSFNLVLLGSLRAVGDTRYPLYSGIPSVLLLLAGGSWLLGVHWAWGLAGIWLAYAADEWARGLLLWRRWLTLQWLPAAQQVIRRMHAEKKRGL
ncbi:MAG: hypothetical protein EB006_14130, partial [Betaproteobacteria bacterium]|nr:hypothetical protein [Betaproteobacteria bacterium]